MERRARGAGRGSSVLRAGDLPRGTRAAASLLALVLAPALVVVGCAGELGLRRTELLPSIPPRRPVAHRAPPTLPTDCTEHQAATPEGCFTLRATRWRVKTNLPQGGLRIFDVELLADGRMIDHDPADITPEDDAWEQEGERLRLFFNHRYATYEARVRGATLVVGTAVNRQDEHWTWLAQRLKDT